MNHSTTGPLSEPQAVHSRIAETLAKHADPRSPLQIQAYARRHLPEHAAAGEIVNESTISRAILPYLDVTILKEVPSSTALSLMPLVRKVSHAWSWEHPGRNAAALRFIAAAERYDVGESDLLTPWRIPWAKSPGPSEILAALGSFVAMDAAWVGGRIAVVTVARKGQVDQVDLWDLASGQSRPLLSWQAGVSAAAIGSTPDGDAVVGIGTVDGLVRYWLVPRPRDRRETWPDVREADPFDIGGEVTALCVTGILSRPHLLAGQSDGRVWLLDCGSGNRALYRPVRLHQGRVTGLTSIELDADRPAAVSVGVDGTVRLSHLDASLRAIGATVRPGGAINAVAALRLASGQPVAVTAGKNGAVSIWDLPFEPARYRRVPGHPHDVLALAAGTGPHGEALVLTGDSHGRLRIVDPDEAAVADVLEGHGNRVTRLAVERTSDGRSIAVSGGADGMVRSWDLPGRHGSVPQQAAPPDAVPAGEAVIRLWRLDDGRELDEDVGTHSHRMAAVAVGYLADGTPVAVTDGGGTPRGARNGGAAVGVATPPSPEDGTTAVSASRDGQLRFWDLTPCPDLPPRPGRPGVHLGVRAVTAATRAGVPVAVSAGQDRVLKIWDMREGHQLGADLTGHERTVTALAVAAAPDRTTVVVSGSEDSSLRIWDLDASRPVGGPFHGFRQRITALAAAWIGDSLITVTAGQGDPVTQWCDLLAAAPRPRQLVGHAGPVTAVAIIRHPHRPLVVTASEDRTVRVWDLLSSAPLQIDYQDLDPIPVHGIVRAIACFDAPSPSAVIAGDDVLAVLRWDGRAPDKS
jgi:WD40 repeat protein